MKKKLLDDAFYKLSCFQEQMEYDDPFARKLASEILDVVSWIYKNVLYNYMDHLL